jgi:hypothetical protein
MVEGVACCALLAEGGITLLGLHFDAELQTPEEGPASKTVRSTDGGSRSWPHGRNRDGLHGQATVRRDHPSRGSGSDEVEQ